MIRSPGLTTTFVAPSDRIIQSDSSHSAEVSITTSFEPANTVPGAADMPSEARISVRTGIKPPCNPITSRLRPIPSATSAVPGIARLYTHQIAITAIAMKNMPGIVTPARLPNCGTAAIASSSQKRGICGRRQKASTPLSKAPKTESMSMVIALPIDAGDDARSGRANAGGSSENERAGDKGGCERANDSGLHW